jgi:hypothetical protein
MPINKRSKLEQWTEWFKCGTALAMLGKVVLSLVFYYINHLL